MWICYRPLNFHLSRYLGSKDAYMLIYSRCKLDPDESPGLELSPHVDPSRTPSTIAQVVIPYTPEPPPHASREIDRLNAAFDQEVQRYEAQYVNHPLRSFSSLTFAAESGEFCTNLSKLAKRRWTSIACGTLVTIQR
jgi:hypothetical protein